MVGGFAKYAARDFSKKLDKFRSKRVGNLKIRHLVWNSRRIFTVRHSDFPDYEIVYKPPKVRKYANKIDQLDRMQGKIYWENGQMS